ncbi:High affinity copper uptake protein 1 [Hondaea fermentalgiana]|uniref:High affinity copper uptake protein 1 n=1 Tax=Hondaea fermentalgiana TaxID=2315210 RepID=A0A2R5GEU1_9STRA|nr:High affinity copper uptake protein 1 [Hondaea fermentalgiana]|eukprot:GBG28839.1 High affinity copper uptake protein 1 [Hondaea fermentalgiana]
MVMMARRFAASLLLAVSAAGLCDEGSAAVVQARAGLEQEAVVEVEQVTFDALLTDVDGSSIRRAVVRDGVFQVTQVPSLKALRQKTFAELVQCMESMGSGVPSYFLADDTIRRTFVAAIEHGQRHDFNLASHFGASTLSTECVAFEKSAAALRELISRVSTLVFAQIDALCGTRQGGEHFALHASGEPYATAQSFLHAGVHLEHFHAYQANCTGSSTAPALEMHTDAGLFIALLPSAFVDARTGIPVNDVAPGLGFLIQDAQGVVGRPALAEDGDVILFMIGQGMTELADRCVPMRPVPHALVMQPACMLGDVVRTWYGRMFLPPADGINEYTQRTFGEDLKIRTSATLQASESFPAGCAHAYNSSDVVMARDLADACGDGEFYCWHQCMAYSDDSGCTDDTDEADVQCVSPDGTTWSPTASPTDHCPTCEPWCYSDSLPETNTEGICNGVGTVMYMFGFASSIDPAENCVNILFKSWTLDTPGKLAGGTIAVFIYGMLVEAHIYARRYHLKNVQDRLRPWQNKLIYMTMYIIQVLNGYFAMLIIMTYSAFLFSAVVLGLAAGHFFFNMNLRDIKGQAAEPCCQFAEEIDDTPDEPPGKAVVSMPPQKSATGSSCCHS